MYNNTKLFIKVLRFISKPKFNALVQKFQTDAYARPYGRTFIRINITENSLVMSIFWSYGSRIRTFVFAQFNNTTSLRELNWAMHR